MYPMQVKVYNQKSTTKFLKNRKVLYIAGSFFNFVFIILVVAIALDNIEPPWFLYLEDFSLRGLIKKFSLCYYNCHADGDN